MNYFCYLHCVWQELQILKFIKLTFNADALKDICKYWANLYKWDFSCFVLSFVVAFFLQGAPFFITIWWKNYSCFKEQPNILSDGLTSF